jgi:hypothetical protein
MTEKLLGFWFNDEEGFGDGAAILQRLSQTRRDGFALAVKISATSSPDSTERQVSIAFLAPARSSGSTGPKFIEIL